MKNKKSKIEFAEDAFGKHFIRITPDIRSQHTYDEVAIDVNTLDIDDAKVVIYGLTSIIRSIATSLPQIEKNSRKEE